MLTPEIRSKGSIKIFAAALDGSGIDAAVWTRAMLDFSAPKEDDPQQGCRKIPAVAGAAAPAGSRSSGEQRQRRSTMERYGRNSF
ncbi:MAG: hypothetical protein M0Z31_14280 [Clostridia bacterium]|nr:hypothetical protein [Clostridia bacterium]